MQFGYTFTAFFLFWLYVVCVMNSKDYHSRVFHLIDTCQTRTIVLFIFQISNTVVFFILAKGVFKGGSVAEWLGRRTWNPEVPGLSPALTTSWICNTVAPSSNPWPRYVNSQLVSLRPVGILNKFTFNLWYLVSAFQVSPISTAVLNTLRLK